jgi:hypothetical protein
MARFIRIPPLDIAPEAEKWILTDICMYSSDLPKGEGTLIIVPEGFITDLASIPRVFRILFVKNGKHRAAAIVHDYLCRQEFNRVLADKIFLEAMKVSKVGRFKRYAMYYAVRINTARLKLLRRAM